jgi:choline dehydrogenase
MSTEQDWQEFRDAIRITREIMQQPALDPYRGEEISPGKDVSTDAELTLCVITLKQLIIHPVVVKWVKMIWR